MRRTFAIAAVCALIAAVLLLASGYFRPASGEEGAVGTVLLGGYATYYDTCPDCAAAGPALRDVLGPGWRGERVTVVSETGSATLKLTDWCACGERHGTPTLIDLSREAFAELAPLSAGVVRVSIEIAGPRDPADDRMRIEDGGPLPATDTP